MSANSMELKTSLLHNFDPNHKVRIYYVRLVFQTWEYRLELVVKTPYRYSSGLDIINQALERYWDEIAPEQEGEIASLTLLSPDGGELYVEDDEEQGREWLEQMLVSACIEKVEEQSRTEPKA